ncbi:MAG TPA: glycosyltransferase family 4 protein [Steroidobacteraceae bacterium]|nr:glycosyltransferase family 4 protein [Steroidobacteraceae bacterium]
MRDSGPRLLFIFSEVFATGGIQRFNQTILDACCQLGIQFHVLSLKDSTAALSSRLDGARVRGFDGNRRRFAWAVARAVIRGDFEKVLIGHINFLALAVAAMTVRPRFGSSMLLIAHGIEVWSGIGRVRRFALSKVDRILCVSSYTRDRIMAQAGRLDPSRLTIFPNALAKKWREETASAPAASGSARFILSVTRLDRGDRDKGVDSAIKAFSMLTDRTLQYFIVGSGNDMGYLQSVAELCGVHDRVRFMQGVGDLELKSLYRTCQAFVLPSGKEGFGIVFLEAMFFGAPVIAAGEKGALDVVRDGETGLTVPFGDVAAIRQAIERIIADRDLRDHLRTLGRSTVLDGGRFTFAAFTARCAEVFESR